MKLIQQFKEEMMRTLEMTDIGSLHYFLGIKVKQTDNGIFIAQERYAIELLKDLHVVNEEPIAKPMSTNEKIVSYDGT